MKIISKETLTFKDGYLIDADGNIMIVPPDVVDGMNSLELWKQKLAFAKKHPQQKLEDIPEFEFMSTQKTTLEDLGYKQEIVTPNLDAMVKKSAAIFHEIEGLQMEDKIDEAVELFMPVLKWVQDETFVSDVASFMPIPFDTATIGDPTKVTTDDLFDIIVNYVGNEFGFSIKED